MSDSHHRKIELQSAADLTYLYGNTVALSRQKLDLHLPPSANPSDGPDPMRERVRELVDEYILRTFTSASYSITINGLDSSSKEFPFPASFTAPTEQVEYEAYDAKLASRVSSLYAQLESLTTTVAQLRRDAPGRAARAYAEQLRRVMEEEEEEEEDKDAEVEEGEDGEQEKKDGGMNVAVGEEEEDNELKEESGGASQDRAGEDREMTGTETGTATAAASRTNGEGRDTEMVDAPGGAEVGAVDGSATPPPPPPPPPKTRRSARLARRAKLQVPLGSKHEAERWRSGDMAEVYEDALRTLLRLQGEALAGQAATPDVEGADGNALASTVGKAERAGRAVEVVEKKK
ncbi:Mis14-domain-containing protein [Aspergillus uvarum CBS 121591]|uniref:Mis14-domain-containing protein n=1 Tax=Aspergillus uvarum CBS 121591 TaxID=1448315 RepID=A0A319C1Y7_9EURO|nr:Mis14-domain-containing protein [Aspergillus uvarum CBS 121591]PYH80026.1 Mis14-domain-containing protein [Aspergillus uvarum CBS 121591]